MKCPHCEREIADELIKRRWASLAGKKSRRAISEDAQKKMQEGRKKKKPIS